MRAIQFTERNTASAGDLPIPELTSGQALVRIKASGVCHTDIEILRGNYGNGAFPLVPGHEFSGIVEKVADDVIGLAVGARVAADPNISCGQCPQCRRGLSNLCANLRGYGVTQHGGFAEYCVVSADHLHDIGSLPYDSAALAEPLGCVLTGLEAAGVNAMRKPPERALVFGAGPIGLLMALALTSKGAASISVVDINEHRLDFAGSLGLKPVNPASGDLESRKKGFDFTVDATGNPSVVEKIIGFTADGGTALVFGVCPQDARISVSPFEIFRRQLHLAGSHSLNRNIPEALGILSKDRGQMAKLVSHRLSLDEIVPFFSKGRNSPATMKVQYANE